MTAPVYFTVEADYKAVVADSASDLDADPQLGPVTATVTFKPMIESGGVILAVDAEPRPTGFVPAPIVARIDTDGRLKLRDDPDLPVYPYANIATFPATGLTGRLYRATDTMLTYRWDTTTGAYVEEYDYAPVRLLADTPLLRLAGPLYYQVTFTNVQFNGGRGDLRGFEFQAPESDTVVNLIEVGRVPGRPAPGMTVGPRGYSIDDISLDGTDLVSSVQGEEVGRVDLAPIIPGAVWENIANKPSLAPKFINKLDLREWVEESQLPNDADSDARSIFVTVMADLAAETLSTGLLHVVQAPAGDYAFSAPLQPPLGGGIGIVGEGTRLTRFFTPTTGAWLGMSQVAPEDTDFRWQNMLFEDFTIDGSRQGDGTSYMTSWKGFSANNSRDVTMRRVRVMNTHATGFGWDYCDRILYDNCIAYNCGRGRLVHTPNVDDRIGSGSGFGLGFGKTRDEHQELRNCISLNNGAAGVFGEKLGQPEAVHHSTGLAVFGGLFEGNTTGINDVGTSGSRYHGATVRNNLFAGMRVGNSVPGERGGHDGIASDMTIYGNKNGIILDGNADTSFRFHHLEIAENESHGIWLRSRDSWAYHGRNKFDHVHIHHNGGCGVFSDSTLPVPFFELGEGVDIHDNGQDPDAEYRDGVCFLSSMVSPKIKGATIRSDHGYAVAFRGAGVVSTDVELDGNDLRGSAGGSYLMEHTVVNDDHILPNNKMTQDTVTQYVQRPTPHTDLTSWTGGNTTRTREMTGFVIDGVAVPHVLGTATSSAPRVSIPAGGSFTAGDIVVCSIYAKAPKGKLIQPHARWDTTFVYGAPIRATGELQRISIGPLVVPANVAQVTVGVIGLSNGPNPWVAGEELRATRANVTKGPYLWPYIDGDQPGCAWSGTAHQSTSILTVPVSTG